MRGYDFVRLAFIGTAVLLATFMLIRVLPALRFILLLVLVVLLVMILLYIWRNYTQERESERTYAASIPGQIQERITNCQEQIKRLQEESGGFGCFLQMAHNWADWPATQRSYELFARYVAPKFQGRNESRRASYRWAAKRHEEFMPRVEQAIGNEIAKDEQEKQAQETSEQ